MLLFPSLHLRTGRRLFHLRGKGSPRSVGLSGRLYLTWGVLLLLAALAIPASAQTPAGVSCPVSWGRQGGNTSTGRPRPPPPGGVVAVSPGSRAILCPPCRRQSLGRGRHVVTRRRRRHSAARAAPTSTPTPASSTSSTSPDNLTALSPDAVRGRERRGRG